LEDYAVSRGFAHDSISKKTIKRLFTLIFVSYSHVEINTNLFTHLCQHTHLRQIKHLANIQTLY
jgi:hypothetical protein